MIKKKQLALEINKYLIEYKNDPFWGGELQFLQARIQSLESSIAVVGQFSVGKSALLNALLGEEFLATRKVESTKILTRIRHCKSLADAKVILTYIDGKTEQLPLKNSVELNKYTTFQGEDITEELQYVDVYWPAQFLNEELVLIDTPGANSITASAFETTKAQLKTSSAIIYLFMGTKGLDAADYKLIQQFAQQKKKIFLVGTHRDQLMDSQWQEVVAEVSSKIDAEQAFGQLEIVGVSSLQALEGKRQQNAALLQESNIGELERMLQHYMEKREYEVAEVRSIENDFLHLLMDIEEEQSEQAAANQQAQQERERRYERLVALTEVEYADVLEYGVRLLKQRTQQVFEINAKYEQQLLQNGQFILTQVKDKYSTYQKQLRASNVLTMKVEQLEASYIQHLNGVEKLYNGWLLHLKDYSHQFEAELERAVQQEDQKFLHMLKLIDTKLSIKWKDFDTVVGQLRLKPVELKADTNDFQEYQKKLEGNAEKEKLIRRQLNQVAANEQEVRRIQRDREQEVDAKQRREQSALGSKPRPREITKTKDFWLWKSEEVVGYDHSAGERWEQDYKRIHEKYREEKRKVEESYRQNLRTVNRDKVKYQQELDQLDDMEEQYMRQLQIALFETVGNQSEIVKKQHSERMTAVKEEWQLIVLEQEENYYKHIQKIEELYKSFIEKSKRAAIQQINVL